jgi:hypothetical protein
LAIDRAGQVCLALRFQVTAASLQSTNGQTFTLAGKRCRNGFRRLSRFEIFDGEQGIKRINNRPTALTAKSLSSGS